MTDPALDMATTWIADFEGFKSGPYLDQKGIPTIAFGFTYLPDGSRVTMQTPAMTKAQAEEILSSFVAKVLASVRGMVYVPISDHAAAALTSLGYNIGTGALRGSTLMRLLNCKEPMTVVAAQFAVWSDAGGRVDPGLVQRRKTEAQYFLTTDFTDITAAAPAATPPEPDEADELDDLYNPPE